GARGSGPPFSRYGRALSRDLEPDTAPERGVVDRHQGREPRQRGRDRRGAEAETRGPSRRDGEVPGGSARNRCGPRERQSQESGRTRVPRPYRGHRRDGGGRRRGQGRVMIEVYNTLTRRREQ